MVETTSSAATMLLSGSTSSTDHGLMNPNFLTRTFLPCSSTMATISASAPFPTITLDLTQSPNPLQLQNFANSSAPSLIPQIFGQVPNNFQQSKFSGLQLSQNSIDSSHLASIPNLADFSAAITKDPNFTAALAVAITSIFGGVQQNNNTNDNNNNVTSCNNNGNVTSGNNNNNGKQ